MYYCEHSRFRDVVHALQRREPRLALRISGNLCSNALNTVRADLRSAFVGSRRAMRRAS